MISNIVDQALELSVVGSFSRIGYEARRRLDTWPEMGKVAGLKVLLTGGTSGLGRSAARALATAGAEVLIVGRNRAGLEESAAGFATMTVRTCDMSSVAQVRDLAQWVLADFGAPDVLIHNAGALDADFHVTDEGLERTHAVHVVSPFVLTSLLADAMPDGGRVITVSSGGMYTQKLDLREATPDTYDGVRAYAKAKRLQVTLNEEWARRYPRLRFYAMHPGWADTPGVRHSLPTFHRVTGPILRSPEQGSDTIVWLASRSDLPSGTFWLDRHRRSVTKLPNTRPSAEDADRAWDYVAAAAEVG